MSEGLDESNIRVQVRDRFPASQIQAFGSGTVGLVYVTFDRDGKIILADADLYDATFDRMIIDDSDILRIFGNGDKISMDLLHPWPIFRLVPADPIPVSCEDPTFELFKTGRLVRVRGAPPMARYGLSIPNLQTDDPFEEGEVHRSIRQTVEMAAEEARQPRGSYSIGANDRNFPDRTRTSSRSSTQQPRELVSAVPSGRPRVTLKWPKRSNIVPGGPNREEVRTVVDDMFALLPDVATREQYKHYVEFVRKAAAKDPLMKLQFHRELEDFVRRYNIVELHNQYASLTCNGSNTIYQLPQF
ncbi:uncharacterized protein K460DRAFT_354846 [Cucurbitaria berberidis CBS 394.84]|uniref:Uncharacterized protein n=1 Tax=Cucurbitaria berberidis CBS 394.84 TaxID=1168544 RepID=A0A9P4L7I1_9PLEO|nr:uncharacterized protein K460DRAFT_354846 [Cucurbitaria berberidis CBS 394.84]KAF1844985.1 hypothetical protein K460DRAFT_354846 [Cucurbitaria berberidis CBS 394.84]